jgi:RNA polymerase sigma-70 factor, ECF subfamily
VSEAFPNLIDRARRGDESAFAVIWRRHNPPLLRYLRVVAGRYAEDVAATTWLEVVRALARFKGATDGEFTAWLFTIGRHRAIDARRQDARRPVVSLADLSVAEDPAADPQVIVPGTRAAVAMIARLPLEQAEVVALRVIVGLDVDVVAGLVGKSPGNVRVITHRALQRLHALLAESKGVTR